jgi:deferrochelatase/peroxidase EfeB
VSGQVGRDRLVWDPLVRALHWGMVASVTVAWLVSEGAVHDSAGYILLALVALRIMIIKAPMHDDLGIADGTPEANDFEFGDDRMGLICPWAAHVRKAYPRDDVPGDPNASDQTVIDKAEAFTQTHRMLRRGIAFGPELTEEEALDQSSAGGSQTRGLLFKCYVTSIDDQFEFVQQQWCNDANFSQGSSGIDPIIGQSLASSRPFLGAAPQSKNSADKPHLNLHSFVHLEGGAYFFAPSIDAMRAL